MKNPWEGAATKQTRWAAAAT